MNSYNYDSVYSLQFIFPFFLFFIFLSFVLYFLFTAVISPTKKNPRGKIIQSDVRLVIVNMYKHIRRTMGHDLTLEAISNELGERTGIPTSNPCSTFPLFIPSNCCRIT